MIEQKRKKDELLDQLHPLIQELARDKFENTFSLKNPLVELADLSTVRKKYAKRIYGYVCWNK